MRGPRVSSRALQATLLALALGCGGNGETPPRISPTRAPEPAGCPTELPSSATFLAPEAIEGKSVARVCVIGKGTMSQPVEKALRVREGAPLTRALVRDDLRELMRMGFFDDAAAYGKATAAGVELLYVVRPRPTLHALRILGARVETPFAAKKIAELEGGFYSPAQVVALGSAICEEHAGEGFPSCRAEVSVAPATNPSVVDVALKIIPGPEVRLTKVVFEGNRSVPEAALLADAKIAIGEPYDVRILERGKLLVQAYYMDRGYADVRVEVAVEEHSAERTARLIVTEGAKYVLGPLHVAGLGAPFEKEILSKVVKARPKQIFSRRALLEDVQRLTTYFEGKGEKVVVRTATSVDSKAHAVGLTFEIEKE